MAEIDTRKLLAPLTLRSDVLPVTQSLRQSRERWDQVTDHRCVCACMPPKVDAARSGRDQARRSRPSNSG
jgi:hypothetical protein